jgi:hypothetical protein
MPAQERNLAIYSHVTVGTADMARATAFYDAVLAPLGLKRLKTYKVAIGYAPEGFQGVNEPFWVMRPYDRKAAGPGNGAMVAFEAEMRRHSPRAAATKAHRACASTIIPPITGPTCAIRTATSCARSATGRRRTKSQRVHSIATYCWHLPRVHSAAGGSASTASLRSTLR